MSRRNILIGVVVFFVLALFFYFFFYIRNNEQNNTTNNNEDSFSFTSDQKIGVNFESGIKSIMEDLQNEELNEDGAVVIPKIRVLSDRSVSGYGLFNDSSTTTVRFVDTESGNIFEANSNSMDIDRVTNTTILQTIDSLWIDKTNLILRYVDEDNNIQSFLSEIRKDDGGDEIGNLVGSFLDKNIDQIDVFDKNIFTLEIGSTSSLGKTYNTISDLDKVILDTPLTEIVGGWADKNTIYINTKPSSKSSGYLFYLNLFGGEPTPVISDVVGLNTNVSKNHTGIIYNKSETTGVSLWFVDTQTNKTIRLGKSTIINKCVWANSKEMVVFCAIPQNISYRNLPDEWYMGNISFSDSLWELNIETGEDRLISDLKKDVGLDIDVLEIKISENNDYIVFTNKLDSTLWSVNLLVE